MKEGEDDTDRKRAGAAKVKGSRGKKRGKKMGGREKARAERSLICQCPHRSLRPIAWHIPSPRQGMSRPDRSAWLGSGLSLLH